MKNYFNTPLTRRAWMVLTGSAVTACGGGGSSLLASLPGTGGTGAVFVQGAIAGFGSVILNGIKFDDIRASVQIDGAAASSADLRLGMVANVRGSRGADLTLGTATSIDVWTVAQGVVAGISNGEILLSGMTILTDSATALDGIDSLTQLAVGQTLAVWGLQAGLDGSRWTATRIALLPAGAPVVCSGLVRMMSLGPALNGLTLMGSVAGTLSEGALVRVQGELSTAGDSLQLTQVRSLDVAAMSQAEGDVEIEGYVTAMASSTRFTLGYVAVDASAVADVLLASPLALGARVEVYGSWRAGVLQASRIEIESEQTLQATEITGMVTAFTSLADFEVRGERCDASAAVISHGQASDLKLGAMVKVKGARTGSVLLVDSLEFES